MGTPSNVIVGSALLFTAPAGTATPTITAATGLCAPSSPWVASGFTEKGVTINVDRKVDNIMVDELSTPVSVVDNTTDITIDITLAEDTLANALSAYGGGSITTQAASGSVAGETILTLADALTIVALCFVATNAAGFSRVLYIPQVVSAGKVKTTYQRTKSPRTYPTTFTAISPLANIVITDVTATTT